MRIKSVEINNYRNLDGITVCFDESCNFIVGENNIGKSNLLSLLNILFSSKAFQYDDFKNLNAPIVVQFQLKLEPIELGHFQDLFDTDDYSLINIVATQSGPDEYIVFNHLETSIFLSPSQVRCLNFIHYNSLRNPIAEINFTSNKGVGKFLRNIISQYLKAQGTTDTEFLDNTKITALTAALNSKVNKIKAFKDFGISATTDGDAENLLSKIILFNDHKGDSLSKTGYGVQFLILITLSILERLQMIKQQRGEKGIFEDELTGIKTISLVLGLDEPEIHLHPYMQRALVKYLNALINNKDSDFKSLVKELFDIDEFTGQIIIVTHSPNILLNNYKQIIRFFSVQSVTKVVSGSEIVLTDQLNKHLYLHFTFIKEAFFSRFGIFVEGDSEISSFPVFAEKMDIDLDELGICIIQAGGDSVTQLIDVAIKFGIPSLGINDKDDGTDAPAHANLRVTNLRDFEEEVVALIDQGKESFLRTILVEYDSLGIERELDAEAINKRAVRKYKVTTISFSKKLKLADIPLADITALKSFYLTWFSINKSYPLGLVVGNTLTVNEIPPVYGNLIRDAKIAAQNV